MAPTSCTDQPLLELAAAERDALLRIARASIGHGLAHDLPLEPAPKQLAGRLAEHHASFVTLYRRRQLRGCVGNLEATRPLARDVARNAWRAASQDPRFAALAEHELVQATIEVAVLSAPQPLPCESESELRQRLVPHADGLLLVAEQARATFLPKVWEHLPQPAEFIRELKRKAGLPPDYWSSSLRFSRYRVVSFADG
jgi:AmmeMemoRadiSam system protein A